MLRQTEIRFGSILHIEKVANELPVTANLESLIAERGLDDPGNQSAEIEIASAEQVPAANDRGGQAESTRVHAGNEIGATLRDFVREPALERMVLAIGKICRLTIGLVRGSH